MFSGFMVNAWIVATIVAVVGGAVGFFVVLRGSAFVAHAIPNGSFAGAAAASLIGINTLIGLGVFAFGSALGIGLLGRRGRHDVATALTLVFALGLGALFLSFTVEYAPEIYSLLFGEVLGISTNQLGPTIVLAAVCLVVLALLYRPLLLSSTLPDSAHARGIPPYTAELAFLILVALATTMTVPVVGTALIFSLMIGPPAAARAFTTRPLTAVALSVAIAVAVAWAAIALSYQTNWPVGFYVGVISAASYAAGRIWTYARRHRVAARGRLWPVQAPRNSSPLPELMVDIVAGVVAYAQPVARLQLPKSFVPCAQPALRALVYRIRWIVSRRVPLGMVTSTVAPGGWFNRALPTGDCTESLPRARSASPAPTRVHVWTSPVPSSRISAERPKASVGAGPSAASTTTASRSRCRSRRIRVSMCAWSSLAAWYSPFSLRSPWPRATLIRAAMSRRPTVSNSATSALRAARPASVIGSPSFSGMLIPTLSRVEGARAGTSASSRVTRAARSTTPMRSGR